MQDIRAAFITALDNLSVTHNATPFTIRAGYWKDAYTLPMPHVLVRGVEGSAPVRDIGSNAELFDCRYDLVLHVLDTDTIDPEVFLKDFANAVNTAVRAVDTSLGGAWGVQITGDRVLPPVPLNGVLVFSRVLTYRAFSAETY